MNPKLLTKISRRALNMQDSLDIQGLPEEQINLLKQFVAFLRQNVRPTEQAARPQQKIEFGTWNLGVKGELTRREIYDYL
jgi:hypothetical protein